MSVELDLLDAATLATKERCARSGQSLLATLNGAARRHRLATMVVAVGVGAGVMYVASRASGRSSSAPKQRRRVISSSFKFLARTVALQAIAAVFPRKDEHRGRGAPQGAPLDASRASQPRV
jgi:hypothetical protein